jgi:hypothetical protein
LSLKSQICKRKVANGESKIVSKLGNYLSDKCFKLIKEQELLY